MGWKQIGNQKYFYESVREGSRVRSVYRGSGLLAECVAARKELERHRGECERREAERRRREDRARQADLDCLVGDTLAAVAEYMQSLGYHRHKRGRWRKRRSPDMAETAPARQAAARRKVKVFGARLDAMTVHHMAIRYAGEGESGEYTRKMVRKSIEEMADELAGGPDGSTPAVQALACTAAICWGEWTMAKSLAHINGKDRAPDARDDLYDRLADRAFRRYIRALKALADVRRVDPPKVAFNFASVFNAPGPAIGPPAPPAIEQEHPEPEPAGT